MGANERLLGKVLRARRREVVLATKFGSVRGPDGSFLGIKGTPEYVRASCEASLERLGVDHIDLYYQHRVDPAVAIEETVGAMADLVRAGKDLEADILPVCEELGIGVVAYSPLGRGFLTGAFKKPDDFASGDYRRDNPRFSSENFARNLQWVEVVSEIAREQGYTPAQIALAWLLDCAPYIVPIPGTRNIKRLKENALSVMVRLGDAELERLYGLLRERPVSGARLAAPSMATIDA